MKWGVESNAYGQYVVFDGDQHCFNAVLRAFRGRGITWIRAGESYRPAKDGYSYDWFVRFDRGTTTAQEFAAKVKPILGEVEITPPEDASVSSLPQSPSLSSSADQIAQQRLAADRLLQALQDSRATVNRGAEEALVAEKRALERAIDTLRKDLEVERTANRQHAFKQRALQEQLDKIAAEARGKAEQYSDMQRSRTRLLTLLEQERTDRHKQHFINKDAAKIEIDLANAIERAEKSNSECVFLRSELTEAQNVSSDVQGELVDVREQLRSAHVENKELHSQAEQANANRDEHAARAESLEQQVISLQELQIRQAESTLDRRELKNSTYWDIGSLIHHCLPKIELSEDSVNEIVEERWFKTAPQLWSELKLLNDYQHGTEQHAQYLERINASSWFEMKKHISDGVQSSRLRIYFEIPKSNTERKRVHVMWKEDKKQQDRFHERLSDCWTSFLSSVPRRARALSR